MATKLRGVALDACPHCDAAKQSYPQHWNKSANCDYPPLAESLHQVVRGALLGDGSLEGNEREKVRITTTNRAFAHWLYDALGRLASGLQKYPNEPPESDAYRVSSLAHPALNQYRDWYEAGAKRIPDPDCLNRTGMTVLYACDGSLTWGHDRQRPRITFKAVDDAYRAQLVALLRSYDGDLTVRAASDHVSLAADDVTGFVDSLLGPVPGVEHKWATSRLEYELHQTTDRAAGGKERKG
jgi:hypothetical protein